MGRSGMVPKLVLHRTGSHIRNPAVVELTKLTRTMLESFPEAPMQFTLQSSRREGVPPPNSHTRNWFAN
jgi:hypothetical protein